MKSKSIIALTSIALISISCTKEDTAGPDTSAEPVASTETAATAVTPYPLDVCIVSGEALGSMGDPIVITHEGREIKFCCDQCLPDFNEDPEKYLAELDAKIAEQAGE
ncbi:hypothetical protein BH23VER1_BH23VER1_22680 [soil metagenome]